MATLPFDEPGTAEALTVPGIATPRRWLSAIQSLNPYHRSPTSLGCLLAGTDPGSRQTVGIDFGSMPLPEDSPLQDTESLDALPAQELFYRAPARFGSIPVDAEPKGWDRHRGFRKLYPPIHLPTQVVERVSLGHTEPHEPNRLIWGDNLHVIRQIPDNTVDLIYIDPPFFSGRQYNQLWGDKNELRSFDDIWVGGLDGYLIWLNARLYEMKRILKPTGSIYVHCDWHASHYIKVELDKLFGYNLLQNEIVWSYSSGGGSKRRLGRKHDTIFWYTKAKSGYTFNVDEVRVPYSATIAKSRRHLFHPKGKVAGSVWDIKRPPNHSKEWIGYPTQKPEAVVDRIIRASSNRGDIVADFFVGGGTTAAVAQRLGRRFIACDQSRVAIAVTAERLKQQSMTLPFEEHPHRDFTVEQWGIYEATGLSQMPAADFRGFVLDAYGATRCEDTSDAIHGWRRQFPIWVGGPSLDEQVTAEDVYAFANAVRRTVQYRQANLRDGEMLAWGFRSDAVQAADDLRCQESVDIDFIRLAQIRIGDSRFRRHVIGRSTDLADYSDFLTFVQPPVVSVGWQALGSRSVRFDAGDTAVVNTGAKLINVQWDFDYDGEGFVATAGYSLQRNKKTKRPTLLVTHKFPRSGVFRVACRIQDSRGGEGMWVGKVDVG